MQRIRYKKLENGIEVSPELLAGNRTVVANILPGGRYSILDVSNNALVVEGDGRTRQEIMKKIKLELISLGVVFDNELRNRVTEASDLELPTNSNLTITETSVV